MEIKIAPVSIDMRFAAHSKSTELVQQKQGVTWGYVVLICGGCILITALLCNIQRQKEQNKSWDHYKSQTGEDV